MKEAINFIEELKGDPDLSRKLKEAFEKITPLLKENTQIAKSKTFQILEELEDIQLSSYDRTQIWELTGLIEQP